MTGAIVVPIGAGLSAGPKLDASEASFYEPSSEEALTSELLGHRIVHAVEFARRFGLFRQIDGVGGLRLHAVGKLVRG